MVFLANIGIKTIGVTGLQIELLLKTLTFLLGMVSKSFNSQFLPPNYTPRCHIPDNGTLAMLRDNLSNLMGSASNSNWDSGNNIFERETNTVAIEVSMPNGCMTRRCNMLLMSMIFKIHRLTWRHLRSASSMTKVITGATGPRTTSSPCMIVFRHKPACYAIDLNLKTTGFIAAPTLPLLIFAPL
jgi:hypothetical protein